MCSGNSKAIQSLFRKIAVFWHIISSVTGQFLLECMWVLIEEILMLLYPSENYCTDVMENEWYIEYLAYAVSNQGETMICRHLSGTWVTLKRVAAFRRITNSISYRGESVFATQRISLLIWSDGKVYDRFFLLQLLRPCSCLWLASGGPLLL